MNVDEEISDIEKTIASVKEEIRKMEYSMTNMKSSHLDERVTRIVLDSLSKDLVNISNNLLSKSMDINVQLEMLQPKTEA